MSNQEILLAEDDPNDEILTLHALEETNICNRVVVAHDGVEALDYLFGRGIFAGREPMDLPAVVLLDLNMPRLNGLDVLREIRADPLTRRLPVVMLTTSKDEQDMLTSYDLGVNSYVRKPVDFDQFTEAVRGLGMYWLLLNERAPD
ncbi:response regulator [Imhoffiella purpurea]|nr:response regulator [Imhoffiella purpurea]